MDGGGRFSQYHLYGSECADHMLSLVSDILDFEQIDSHRLKFESVPFSVVDETHKIIDILRFSAGSFLSSATVNVQQSTNIRLMHPNSEEEIGIVLRSISKKTASNGRSIQVRWKMPSKNSWIVVNLVKLLKLKRCMWCLQIWANCLQSALQRNQVHS